MTAGWFCLTAALRLNVRSSRSYGPTFVPVVDFEATPRLLTLPAKMALPFFWKFLLSILFGSYSPTPGVSDLRMCPPSGTDDKLLEPRAEFCWLQSHTCESSRSHLVHLAVTEVVHCWTCLMSSRRNLCLC